MSSETRFYSYSRIMKYLLLIIFILSSALWTQAQDSTRIEQLLRNAPEGTSGQLMLHFAKQFIGVPYMAHTLEQGCKEDSLIVNLCQFDCTTLVENCVALTLTVRQGSNKYSEFKKNLNSIRYDAGQRNGYASRNHYFHQWIRSNEALGYVQEIQQTTLPFTARQRISLHYMTVHPSLYGVLTDEEQFKRVLQNERHYSGEEIRYIPHKYLNEKKTSHIGIIKDGDILAIVTRKDGLDVSHLGIAVWSKDQHLHLLNASQVHKRVVLEPMTLYQYMKRHPSQLGIRVIRVK